MRFRKYRTISCRARMVGGSMQDSTGIYRETGEGINNTYSLIDNRYYLGPWYYQAKNTRMLQWTVDAT